MAYDIGHFRVALLIVLALGCGCGRWCRSVMPTRASIGSPTALGALLFVVGLALALLHAVPGRPGLLLETVLLLSTGYAGGFGLGAVMPGPRSQATAALPHAAAEVRTRHRILRPRPPLQQGKARFPLLVAAAIVPLATLLLAFLKRRRSSRTRRR